MSDKQKSTPPPIPDTATWEAFAVYRETFLANLTPEDAAAYRHVGRRMYFDRIESFRLEDLAAGESPTRGDLCAAAADLAVLAGFLASVGDGAELPPAEAALARLAQDGAAVLTGLENRLRSALTRAS